MTASGFPPRAHNRGAPQLDQPHRVAGLILKELKNTMATIKSTDRWSIVRVMDNGHLSQKPTDVYRLQSRAKAFMFIGQMDGGTKWALMDASKSEEEGYKPTKYDGGIEPVLPKTSKAKEDNRERVEILLRVTGQVSKSGTCAVAVGGDYERLFGLAHYHNREFSSHLEGTYLIGTYAIDEESKSKRVMKDLRKATNGEVFDLLTKEVNKAELFAPSGDEEEAETE